MDRSEKSIQRHMAEFVVRCREKGLSVTSQRLAVYRTVLESGDHPSPDLIRERLRQAMPSLSLATVYKTLDTLVDLGAVREVYGAGAEKRFDANLERHHHLLCERCGRIEDLYEPRFDRLKAPGALRGFRPRSVRVQVEGLCGACAAETKRARR